MRFASLMVVLAGTLLASEATACSVQYNQPNSCYAPDPINGYRDGPGAETDLARRSATTPTVTDHITDGPGQYSGPMPQEMTPEERQRIQNLSKSVTTITSQPPKPATTTPPINPAAYSGYRATSTFPVPKTGGVTLSRAAAERLPLNISLDASSLANGQIVLSGREDKQGIDAALLLTTLRLSCEERDPYFSLDPDDGEQWSNAGRQLSQLVLKRMEKEGAAKPRNASPELAVRTISAARDYPDVWDRIAPAFPHFRSKLVFYPEWMRQTRFGEILYKADVLLKELSSGVPVLVPGALRASQVNGYLSADAEYVAKTLLDGSQDRSAGESQWRGSRLWFDIAPSPPVADAVPDKPAAPIGNDPQLRSIVSTHGLVRASFDANRQASLIVRDGSVFDLSRVNPSMFVRVHDHVSKRDLSDHDPRLDGLAADVTARFDRYADAYDELRMLRDLLRAYIAAVQITARDEHLCGQLAAVPLLNSEKVSTALPLYRRSDLFVTLATYRKNARETRTVQISSVSGGVSLAGRTFSDQATRDGQTELTRTMTRAISGDRFDDVAKADPSRRYVMLAVYDAPQLAAASNAAVAPFQSLLLAPRPKGSDDYEIENEPPPERLAALGGRNQSTWVLVLLVLAVGGIATRLVASRKSFRR